METAAMLSLVRQLLVSGDARRLREAVHLSRADVARELGVHESTVQRWEARRRVPRLEIALQYGTLLSELAGIIEAG